MKVLFIANRFDPALGGVEVVTRDFSTGLVELGHQVDIYTTDFEDSHGYDRLTSSPILEHRNVERFKGLRLKKDPFTIAPGMFIQLLKKSSNYDVIVMFTYGYPTSWVPGIMSNLGLIKTPIVFFPSYAPNDNFPKLFLKLFDKTLGYSSFRASNRIVLQTKRFYQDFLDMDFTEVQLPIVPPPVTPIQNVEKEISHKKIKEYGLSNSRYILSLSRVVEYKGIHLLLKGFAEYCDVGDQTDLKIVIAGDGDYRDSLERLCIELDIVDKVVFTGRVSEEEKNILYQNAWAFSLLSYSGESFGITLVEAMSCGLPIIGSSIGAIPFVVKDGENGLIVDPFDSESVRDAIEKLTKMGFREKISRNNRYEFVKYLPKETVKRFESVLFSAIR
jgi:glycosyltransferase involved in cell wall biosynthesis